MVASQHPLRFGSTQKGLLPLVASSSQLPNSKPSAAVPAAELFYYSSAQSSKLVSQPRNKKAHAVRVGFVTPSGFKPETF
jgi:hypothetical protein